MKTYMANNDSVDKKWWLIDATDKTVGRLATEIAKLLRGKHKPEFTPHADTGDFVVVVNVEKVRFTGSKLDQKKYFSHSRFFGSLKTLTARQLLEQEPSEVLKKAVKGMLPTNKLSNKLIMKMKAYKGSEHPHQSQKPEMYNLN